MSEKHIPFSCGSQSMDWVSANCARCTKYNPEGKSDCEIVEALNVAFWEDGSVSEEIAERMGLLDHSPPRQDGISYNWPCKEVVWTPEWQAEWNARPGVAS